MRKKGLSPRRDSVVGGTSVLGGTSVPEDKQKKFKNRKTQKNHNLINIPLSFHFWKTNLLWYNLLLIYFTFNINKKNIFKDLHLKSFWSPTYISSQVLWSQIIFIVSILYSLIKKLFITFYCLIYNTRSGGHLLQANQIYQHKHKLLISNSFIL